VLAVLEVLVLQDAAQLGQNLIPPGLKLRRKALSQRIGFRRPVVGPHYLPPFTTPA
jgi:hypothetical protein